MKNWTKILVSPETSIRRTLEIIDAGSMQLALVVNDQHQLLGTVTDGDVRRGILKGISLQEPVSAIMNSRPTVATVDETRAQIRALMKAKNLQHIPLVDQSRAIIDLEVFNNWITPVDDAHWVVLMAGGLGSRLRPLTDDCPKPMLKVGDKPLLETIINNFADFGLRHFYVTVHYKADMVMDHFGDGSKFGVEIRYVQEDEQLGTAGSLGLLPDRPSNPLIVMNADLLTKLNFRQLLTFHKEQQAKATMCVRQYDFQVPFGVVNMDKHRITGIDEKPFHRFFVNAGVYVLEPDVLDLIPKGSYLDMPNFFNDLVARRLETIAFAIREDWLDIGRHDDYEKAQSEYTRVFLEATDAKKS